MENYFQWQCVSSVAKVVILFFWFEMFHSPGFLLLFRFEKAPPKRCADAGRLSQKPRTRCGSIAIGRNSRLLRTGALGGIKDPHFGSFWYGSKVKPRQLGQFLLFFLLGTLAKYRMQLPLWEGGCKTFILRHNALLTSSLKGHKTFWHVLTC